MTRILHIWNSVCRLEGFTVKELSDLRKILVYQPKTNYFTRAFSHPKYLIDKRGNFPSGLIPRVYSYIQAQGFEVQDHRRIPQPVLGLFKDSKLLPLRPFQNNAVKDVLRYKRGIISCVTGSGKSLIAAGIIQALEVPTLVVVPSLELKRQLTETLEEIFGKAKVGKGKPITVKNIDEIDLKKPETSYACVIIDEFHHSGAATYRKANQKCWNEIYYRIGLTATPYRSQDNEQILLESVLSQIIHTFSYAEAVEQGYVVPVEAFALESPKIITHGKNWQSVYKDIVVNNDTRNQIIGDMLINLASQKKSTLCLVKEIEHGNILAEYCKSHFANGELNNTKELVQAFNQQKIHTLIGTTGVLGEGIDTRPCEYVIIAGLGKSRNAFLQNVGRGLRRFGTKETCKVVVFLDKSHKWSIQHFKEQVKMLREEYGVEVTYV